MIAEGGYGIEHRGVRARLRPLVDAGEAYCARCGLWIEPGSRWDVGHSDDRSEYTGPEHRRCNVGASNRLRARKRRARYWSREW